VPNFLNLLCPSSGVIYSTHRNLYASCRLCDRFLAESGSNCVALCMAQFSFLLSRDTRGEALIIKKIHIPSAYRCNEVTLSKAPLLHRTHANAGHHVTAANGKVCLAGHHTTCFSPVEASLLLH
jgi:acyl-CoA synthetase (AMP-forming)/AMP-acid ligase II